MCDCDFLPHYFIWSTEDTQQLYPNRLVGSSCMQVCALHPFVLVHKHPPTLVPSYCCILPSLHPIPLHHCTLACSHSSHLDIYGYLRIWLCNSGVYFVYAPVQGGICCLGKVFKSNECEHALHFIF